MTPTRAHLKSFGFDFHPVPWIFTEFWLADMIVFLTASKEEVLEIKKVFLFRSLEVISFQVLFWMCLSRRVAIPKCLEIQLRFLEPEIMLTKHISRFCWISWNNIKTYFKIFYPAKYLVKDIFHTVSPGWHILLNILK